MTRREVFVLVKNLVVSFFLSGLLSGCEYSRSKKTSTSSLVPEVAFLLGYLLYGDNPPLKELKKLKSISRPLPVTLTGKNGNWIQYTIALLKTKNIVLLQPYPLHRRKIISKR